MIRYASENLQHARKNRKQRNATRQEGILWHCYLKRAPVRFFRQYRVLSYILDFYAPTIKLCIEIDGGQHYEEDAVRYDEMRTKELNSCGIKVLRFTNFDIDKNLQGTTTIIENVVKERKGGE